MVTMTNLLTSAGKRNIIVYSMKKIIIAITIALFISANTAFAENITYEDKKFNFSISYPSNFRSMKNFKGARLAIIFPIKSFMGFLKVNALTVTATTVKRTDRPLEELIEINYKYDGTVIDKGEVIINDIKFFSVLQRKEQSFWFFKLNLKLYNLIAIRGSTIYAISYAGLSDTFDNNIDAAKKIMQTFKFVR